MLCTPTEVHEQGQEEVGAHHHSERLAEDIRENDIDPEQNLLVEVTEDVLDVDLVANQRKEPQRRSRAEVM